MDVLSFPLKLTSKGEFVKVETTSDDYKAQQIKAFMSTHKEERKVFPAFGITDPTFEGLGSFEIIDAISQFYGVSLAIEEVEVIKEQGALETIEVKFT